MYQKPKAVIISDIHFNLQNLELATKALMSAFRSARALLVPLIIAGDLNDTKALMRGEVVNRLLEIFTHFFPDVTSYTLVGNHDLINERGKEHTLNFLSPFTILVDEPWSTSEFNFIPYQSNAENFYSALMKMPKDKLVIAHQGVRESYMGDYIQDKSAISLTAEVLEYTIISGHYHRHQVLADGKWTYIGNPYTMSFGEAKDGDKGYLIVYDDLTLKRDILNLRRHITLECHYDQLYGYTTDPVRENDLLWLKLTGKQSQLNLIDKSDLGQSLIGHSNFKLDLIVEDDSDHKNETYTDMTSHEIMLKFIDDLQDTDEHKKKLKEIYNEILES